jgi:hypothetical protein
MFGWMINYLLPLRIGDIARGAALKTTENTPLSVGLFTIVIERAMDMLVLAIMLGVAIILILNDPEMVEIAVLTLVVALGLLAFLAAFYRYDRLIVSKMDRWFPAIAQSMGRYKAALLSLSGNPMAIGLCLILSFPVWLLEASSIYFAAMAFHYPLTMAMAILAGVVAFIVQAIPTTPGGIGVQEGTIAGVLLLFGVNTSVGTSIALLDHFARGIIIFLFGMVSAIHIGFESRQYFAVSKNDEKVVLTEDLVVPRQ